MKLIKENIPIPSPEKLAHWVSSHAPACWLDSALPGHPRNRFSLAVFSPLATLQVERNGSSVLNLKNSSRVIDQPFSFLEGWLEKFYPSFQNETLFCGGALGFLAYESYALRLPLKPCFQEAELPTAFFLLADTGLVLDHLQNQAWVFSLGLGDDLKSVDPELAKRRCADLIEILQRSPHEDFSIRVGAHGRAPLHGNIHYDLPRSRYLEKVQTIREAIFRGDCYQVNFSQRFSVQGHGDPAGLYLKFRSTSPAPQMAFFNLGGTQILSGSPEVLVEVEGRVARSFPIKGTRPRRQEASDDRSMGQELLGSEKDNAELLMIVDLMRNDLGKICEIGSIRVPSLKTLESFAQVHHLVAEVQGRIRKEVGPLQALLELSPGGSITGAPKLKAMEIINQLEDRPRGVYTGSIGYAGFNSRSCFNIAIRTAVCRLGRIDYWAGGGVVADSDPEAEYEESLDKARGFFEAVGVKGLCQT